MGNGKITSYVFISLGFLFYLLAGAMKITSYGTDNMETSGNRHKYSRWLFTLSALFIAIATFASANDKKLDSRDYMNIIIVALALLLVMMLSWKQIDLFMITLATTIAIFSSVQLVIIS